MSGERERGGEGGREGERDRERERERERGREREGGQTVCLSLQFSRASVLLVADFSCRS